MTDSGVRLLALTILFPVLVIVALAVALVGCDAQRSVTKPTIALDATSVYVTISLDHDCIRM